ncbi:MAG: hypothetical protein Q9164_003726 [Protoblastenia rupestris]
MDTQDLFNTLFLSSSVEGVNRSHVASGKVGGMGILDTTEPLHPTWTNLTDNFPFIWSSTSQYVHFGKEGVIVSLGGNEIVRASRDMSHIQTFDLESQTWSQITATGKIPKPRTQFCYDLSAALDDSSFQLIIYGGSNDDEGIGFEDVYVLTMPAFRWIKIQDKGASISNYFN